MYIQKLEIQGFKTFVKKTTLSFADNNERKGLVVIVGPNGSGKSNIVDAIRWVMGEQGMKVIRTKKPEDVIFAGSAQCGRTGLAEVSLHLVNDNKDDTTNRTEIIIKRKLYRDGQSEYFINNDKVRLYDISLLLAQMGIVQKTFSVIGQGMVDHILTMSSTDRKDFIDEASGIKHLKLKKDEAQRKLDTSSQNLREAELLIAELEPRVRLLSRQIKKLEKRDDIEKRLHKLKIEYYGCSLVKLNTEIVNLNKILQDKQLEINLADKTVIDLRNQLTLCEKETIDVSIFANLQNQYDKLINSKRDAEIKLATLKFKQRPIEKLEIQKTEIVSLLKNINDEQKNLLDQISTVKTVNEAHLLKNLLIGIIQNIVSIINKIEGVKEPIQKPEPEPLTIDMQGQIATLDQQINQVRKELTNFNALIEKNKTSFFHWQRQLQAEQNKLSNLLSTTSSIKIDIAKVDTRKNDLMVDIGESAVQQADSLEMNLEQAPVDINLDQHKSEIDHLTHEMYTIGEIDCEAVKEYDTVNSRYEFLKTSIEDLTKTINDLIKITGALDKTMHEDFTKAFRQINEHFEKYFKILFQGGTAKLTMMTSKQENDDNTEPSIIEDSNIEKTNYEIGVDMFANPPGKRMSNINSLSGGEKALTALAFIAALVDHGSSPFVAFDEVDAALDEANSNRFANIINELSKKTQFIVITHNRTVMLKGLFVYGITMTDDGTSKLLSLKFDEADKQD